MGTYVLNGVTLGPGITPDGGASIAGQAVQVSQAIAANSASISFTGLTNAYSNYIIMIDNAVSASGSVYLQMYTGTGSYTTSGNYSSVSGTNNGTAVSTGTTNAAYFTLSPTSTLGTNGVESGAPGLSGIVTISGVAQSGQPALFTSNVGFVTVPGNAAIAQAGGWQNSIQSITAIKLQFSSGNITSGVFTLYGLV